MDKDCVAVQLRQNMTPFVVRNAAPEYADTTLLVGTPDIAGYTREDVRLHSHETASYARRHMLGHLASARHCHCGDPNTGKAWRTGGLAPEALQVIASSSYWPSATRGLSSGRTALNVAAHEDREYARSTIDAAATLWRLSRPASSRRRAPDAAVPARP